MTTIINFDDISNNDDEYVQFPADDDDLVMCDIHELHTIISN